MVSGHSLTILGETIVADEKKKCVVGFRKIWASPETVWGKRPDYEQTKSCCAAFDALYRDRCFGPNPDDVFYGGPGIQLLVRGELGLYLNGRVEVRFCPFCGAEAEIKQTSEVIRKRRKKLIDDGYDEVPYTPPKTE
ncbi:MAG: hypothetical protein AAB631_03235 [Patescibacteria group bacterium]